MKEKDTGNLEEKSTGALASHHKKIEEQTEEELVHPSWDLLFFDQNFGQKIELRLSRSAMPFSLFVSMTLLPKHTFTCLQLIRTSALQNIVTFIENARLMITIVREKWRLSTHLKAWKPSLSLVAYQSNNRRRAFLPILWVCRWA